MSIFFSFDSYRLVHDSAPVKIIPNEANSKKTIRAEILGFSVSKEDAIFWYIAAWNTPSSFKGSCQSLVSKWSSTHRCSRTDFRLLVWVIPIGPRTSGHKSAPVSQLKRTVIDAMFGNRRYARILTLLTRRRPNEYAFKRATSVSTNFRK